MRTQPWECSAVLSQQAHSSTRLEGERKARQAEIQSSGRKRMEEEVAAAADGVEEEEGRLMQPGEPPRRMMTGNLDQRGVI